MSRWKMRNASARANQYDPLSEWTSLTSNGIGHRLRQRSSVRTQGGPDDPASATEHQVGQPPDQQCGARPEEGGRGEGPVGHRDGGHALWRENELVAVSAGQPEQYAGCGEQHDIDLEPGPRRGSGGGDGRSTRGDAHPS